MTFENLPRNWSDLPLDEIALAGDVIDLLVSERDRVAGCIVLLLCDERHRLVQPVLLEDVGPEADPTRMDPFLDELCRMLARSGSIVLARGRLGSRVLTDQDRAVHERLLAACSRHQVRLLSAWVATPRGVRSLPAPLTEADLAS